MENSIGLLLRGGLGNQLFQVFTLISKAIDTNKDFYILHDIGDKRQLNVKLFSYILDKIKSNSFNISSNQNGIYHEKESRKYSEIPNDAKFLIGHYESQLYFNHNKNKIIEILKLNELQFKCKFNFKKIIAIHFRFEDCITAGYVQKPIFYINAINKLQEEIKDDFYNYKFIIFSSKGEHDDYLTDKYIENINNNLDKSIDFIKFKDLYPNIETEEEFLYMSNCNYFIIPASTFSWFAYYLSPFNNKKAIVSNKWFNMNDIELYNLDGFIKIDSDIYEEKNIQLYNI
jgi:hypothetical protein